MRHITEIHERDSAGHWSWSCTEGDADASGYETADEVLGAATAHGPLAADSLIPEDEEE